MNNIDKFLNWCPEKTPESLAEAVQDKWEFLGKYGFPVPRGDWPKCHICGNKKLHYSQISFAGRPGATEPHRLELQFKCCSCSSKVLFGIPITEEHWNRFYNAKKTYRWRDVLSVLEKEELDG